MEDAAQAKLVRCAWGAVRDVAVDMRQCSPTYKKWVEVELEVDWGVENLIVSEKDKKKAPLLKDSDIDFVYKGK